MSRLWPRILPVQPRIQKWDFRTYEREWWRAEADEEGGKGDGSELNFPGRLTGSFSRSRTRNCPTAKFYWYIPRTITIISCRYYRLRLSLFFYGKYDDGDDDDEDEGHRPSVDSTSAILGLRAISGELVKLAQSAVGLHVVSSPGFRFAVAYREVYRPSGLQPFTRRPSLISINILSLILLFFVARAN